MKHIAPLFLCLTAVAACENEKTALEIAQRGKDDVVTPQPVADAQPEVDVALPDDYQPRRLALARVGSPFGYEVIGNIAFQQPPSRESVRITAALVGFPTRGSYPFLLVKSQSCEAPVLESASERIELTMLEVSPDRVGTYDELSEQIILEGEESMDGWAVAVYAPDRTESAGELVACGIIRVAEPGTLPTEIERGDLMLEHSELEKVLGSEEDEAP